MLESAQQTKKVDLNYYIINHQWFRVAYIICVICKTHIRKSCLQRQHVATLSLIINKKRKKERIKKDSKHFPKLLPGILREFP